MALIEKIGLDEDACRYLHPLLNVTILTPTRKHSSTTCILTLPRTQYPETLPFKAPLYSDIRIIAEKYLNRHAQNYDLQ